MHSSAMIGSRLCLKNIAISHSESRDFGGGTLREYSLRSAIAHCRNQCSKQRIREQWELTIKKGSDSLINYHC